MNPPYSAGSNSNFTEGGGLNGMSNTKIGTLMSGDEMGRAKQQLYVQFMYRCMIMGVKNIAIFSKPLFMTGGSFHKFLTKFEKEYSFDNGFLMNSSEFADVVSWGLSFTIWSNKK